MKLWAAVFLISNIVIGQSNLIEINPYKISNKPSGIFNVIILVNQINQPFQDQSILSQVIKKSNHVVVNASYHQLTNELYKNGYQLIFVSYLKRNELYHPKYSQTHLYHQYKIRRSKLRLNQERVIFSEAFEELDKYVSKEYFRRPLCIIIHLPPKIKYQLELKNKNDQRTFEDKRDFSLINLYHELHKRRYLYPNKLVVYSGMNSEETLIINNQ